MKEVRLHGSNRYDSMDGGGRAKQDARAESRVRNGDRERLRTPTHMQLVDDVQDVQMPREHGQRKRQTSGTSFRDKVEQIVSAFKQFYMTLSGIVIVR